MRAHRTLALAAALATLGVLGACGGERGAPAAAPPVAQSALDHPVLLDYSPTLSDVGALLYLAAHPDVDLRGVTLAGTGESRCAAAVPNTLALLDLAGRSDVPVACGRTEPIGPGNEWPALWRDAADKLAPLELADTVDPERVVGSANALLSTVAGEAADAGGVVVVALGPLTNIADAIDTDPGIVEKIAMVWSMGGALGVAGNAPGSAAEWNFYVDPTAVDVVLRSGVPTALVPLDATNHVPADYGLYRRLTQIDDSPAAEAVLDLWTGAMPWRIDMFLWDELTAVVAAEPALAPLVPQRIEMVTSGPDAGRTVTSADGVEVLVAGRPDRRAVEAELLDRLAAAPAG